MTPAETAIVGLFFAIWAHEQQHVYEKEPSRFRLVCLTVMSVSALGLLAIALLRAILT